MDTIYECAAKYIALESFEYRFVVSSKRRCQELLLNFQDQDFYHLAGLQYLTDISIPKNRQDTLKSIIEKKKITDELLRKSRFYTNSKSIKDIKSRIEELRFLEQYLDTDNIIRIFNTKNDKYLQSFINADYFIESQCKDSSDRVYIFLKRRSENPNYLCVISFFPKSTTSYPGDLLYWMLKEKRSSHECITLYRHPNYKNE